MKKEYVLLGILSVILLTAGIWIYQIVSEYQKAEQEYEQLQEYVKIEKSTRKPENAKPNIADDDKKGKNTGRNCNGGFCGFGRQSIRIL